MDLKQYCDANGVPYKETDKGLRVMDTTLLPGALRGEVDERGFVVAVLYPEDFGAVAAAEPEPEPKQESEPEPEPEAKPKGRKK